MKDLDTQEILIGVTMVFALAVMFFTGIAVRDDIFTHETAKNIATVLNFFLIACVFIYIYKFGRKRD